MKEGKDRKNTHKIYDNDYGAVDPFKEEINFDPDPTYIEHTDFEDELTYDLMFEKVQGIIEQYGYDKFNEKKEDGTFKKLNKQEINDLYEVLSKNVGDHSKIMLISIITDYFHISYNKLYDSLANTYKEDIIKELGEAGMIPDNILKAFSDEDPKDND